MSAHASRVVRLLPVLAIAALCVLPARAAHAAVLTFEELKTGSTTAIAPLTSFAGFDWTGTNYVANPGASPNTAALAKGTIDAVSIYSSGTVVMRRSQRFSVTAAYLTAMQDTTNYVVVQGYRAGQLISSRTYIAQLAAQRFTFNLQDVDEVRFNTLGRTIVFDNVEYAVTQDLTPPTIQLDPVPDLTSDAALQLSGCASDASGVPSGPYGVAKNGTAETTLWIQPNGCFQGSIPLVEGTNAIVVQIPDLASNVASRTVSVVRDSTPPYVEVVSPTDGAVVSSATIPIAIRVVDASDVREARVRTSVGQLLVLPVVAGFATGTLDGTFLPDGPLFLSVEATDAAGLTGVAHAQIWVDASAPRVTVDVASGSSFGPLPGDALPVEVTVDDLSETTVTFPSGETWTLPGGVHVVSGEVALGEGENALTFAVSDPGGRATTVALTVVYDKTPPVVGWVSPGADAAVRGAVELGVTASDALTSVSSVSFSVDDGPSIAAAPGATWDAAVDLAALPDGAHALHARATDAVGNAASAASELIVDATPPIVEIVSPAQDAWVREAFTFSAAAADATSGVRSIHLLVNGATVATCADATACETIVDSTALADGPLLLSAVATDAAGNDSPLAQRTVTVDNGAPARFLRSPAPGATVSGTFEVVAEAVDDAFAWIECAAGDAALGRVDGSRFSATVDTRGLLDGPLTVTCTAADLAGNTGTEEATVTVRNWTVELAPRMLNLASKGSDRSVTVTIEGENVTVLLPVVRDLALVVPGGSPVVATPFPASQRVGDADGDGVRDLLVKFDRALLVSAIRGALDAGVLPRGESVPLDLVADGRTLARVTVDVR